MKSDVDEFENYWNNKNDTLEVIDIPEAVKKEFIKISPKN